MELFRLKTQASWEELAQSKCEILYAESDDGENMVFYVKSHLNKEALMRQCSFIVSCEPYSFPSVDYAQEWERHSPYFINGRVELPLGEKKLYLNPGAGFGDLSHPTTVLCLDFLKDRVQGKTVLDIGSGSGVLSLASLILGAQSAVGIDIDKQAIIHARQNAKINGLCQKSLFCLPEELPQMAADIGLMNMIQSEQEIAIEGIHLFPQHMIVSGVLVEQEKEYFKFASKMGWSLVERKELDGWCGFVYWKI